MPIEHANRGFHRLTVSENGYERTASLLTGTLGLKQIGKEGNRFRYAVAKGAPSTVVDLVSPPQGCPGRISVGAVPHVAWRTAIGAEQPQWRNTLINGDCDVTPVIDRQYFHSIYFRESGGVLFEIATDPPGFAIDETVERLGSSLKLPPGLEYPRPEWEQLSPRIGTA